MNLLPNTQVLNITGPIIPYHVRVDEVSNNLLEITPTLTKQFLASMHQQLASSLPIFEFCKQASNISGIQVKSVAVDTNCIYRLKCKLQFPELPELQQHELKSTGTPMILFIQSSCRNSSWYCLKDTLIKHHSQAQFIQLELYIPEQMVVTNESIQTSGGGLHEIHISFLFHPNYLLLHSSLAMTCVFSVGEFEFYPIQMQVCTNQALLEPPKSNYVGRQSSMLCYFDSIFILCSSSSIHHAICLRSNLKLLGLPAELLSVDIEEPGPDQFLRLLIKTLEKAQKSQAKRVLFIQDNVTIHCHFQQLWDLQSRILARESWALLFLSDIGSKPLLHSLDNLNSSRSNVTVPRLERVQATDSLENETLLWELRLGAFACTSQTVDTLLQYLKVQHYSLLASFKEILQTQPSFAFQPGLFTVVDVQVLFEATNPQQRSSLQGSHGLLDISEEKHQSNSMTSSNRLKNHCISQIAREPTCLFLKKWQSSQTLDFSWKKHSLSSTTTGARLKHFLPLTTFFQESIENIENITVNILLYLESENVTSAKLQLDLTILNLLIQRYPYWSLMICMSASLYAKEIEVAIDGWKNYLRCWFHDSMFVRITMKVLPRVKLKSKTNDIGWLFDLAEQSRQQFEQIMQGCPGKLILIWNPYEFSHPDRLACQVAPIYLQNCFGTMLLKECSLKDCSVGSLDWLSYYESARYKPPPSDIPIYQPLLQILREVEHETLQKLSTVEQSERHRQYNLESICMMKPLFEKWVSNAISNTLSISSKEDHLRSNLSVWFSNRIDLSIQTEFVHLVPMINLPCRKIK